jgi:hypothetical protein
MNPSIGVPYTLTGVANTPAGCNGFRIVVTTVGSLFAVYKDGKDTDVCELPYTTGVHHEPGEFKQIWDDGTIVTDPVDTIIRYGE